MLAQGHDFTGGVTPEMVLAPVRRLLADRGCEGTSCNAER
jgi:hypothetical protein